MRPVDKMKPVRDGQQPFAESSNFSGSYFAQETKDSYETALRLEVYRQAIAMLPSHLIGDMPKSFAPLVTLQSGLRVKIANRLMKVNPTATYQQGTTDLQNTLVQVDAFVNHVPAAEAIKLANATLGDMLAWLNLNRPEDSAYTDSRERMIPEIGAYCSFCERPIKAKLDVEHMAPKSIEPSERFRWRNFLLACANCNSAKSDRYIVRLVDGNGHKWEEVVPLTYCFWPDRITHAFDNAATPLHRAGPHAQDSFNVFQYEEFGVVRIHPNVDRPSGIYDRVLATLAIVHLDVQPNQGSSPVDGMAYVAWGGKGKPLKEEIPKAFDDLSVSRHAPPRLMRKISAAHPVPVIRMSRQLVNAQAIYHDFKSAVGDAKDYRAFHRNEAWQIAERFRRKFDRVLPGNRKMNGRWKDTAEKVASERVTLATDRMLFAQRVTQFEADRKTADDVHAHATQECVQLRQQANNAATFDEWDRLSLEAQVSEHVHDEEHKQRDSQLEARLRSLSDDHQILEARQDELDEMESENAATWNAYIAKDQGLTEAQWHHHLGQMTNFVYQQAEAQGHWSVWVTVFKARAPDAAFLVRPAVIPVLQRLLTLSGTISADQFNPPLFTQGAWDDALPLHAQSDVAVWAQSQHIKHQISADERAEQEARRKQEADKDSELQRLRLELARERQENQRLRADLSTLDRERQLQRSRAEQRQADRQRAAVEASMDDGADLQGSKRRFDGI